MKISRELPQFDDERVLLLAVSSHNAVFYEAGDGKITKVGAFKIPNRQYSDREGFFKTRSSRSPGVIRSGSTYEPMKHEIVRETLRKTADELKKFYKPSDLSQIIIFCPSHIHTVVENSLPVLYRRKVSRVIKGNYHDLHPFELLKKVGGRSRQIKK